MTEQDTFITISKASKLLGVCTHTLRIWDKKGKLTSIRHPISNFRLYRMSDIEKVLLYRQT